MYGKVKRVVGSVLAFALAGAMCLTGTGGVSMLAAVRVPVNGYTYSNTGNKVKVVSNKSYNLVEGVTETDIVLNDASGDAQVMGYMTSISPDANVKLKATYSNYYSKNNYNKTTGTSSWSGGKWALSTTSSQAAAYEAATGENVIFATNGDYFNMQTGQPYGTLILNGVNCNPDKTAAEPYFAVLKDGSYVIRDAGTDTSDVQEAVGSAFYLVKNGVNAVDRNEPSRKIYYPVNSVGFKADGTLVFFMVDGRQYPASVGMTQLEIADFLVAQGVVTALYLDGGGSATVMTEREGEEKLTIRNNPSDGVERGIASGFLLIANKEGDGTFDHASVSPYEESYTPYSTVSFEATGVDSTGGAAALPESGLSWGLAGDSASMGTIDAASGQFVSNGKAGDVTVQLKYNGVVVGESQIHIVEPDEIYFTSSSLSLDFGETSDLGFVVRSGNKEIHYRDEDFTWDIQPETENVTSQAFGTMNGSLFVAGESDTTMQGTVSVSYTNSSGKELTASIHVEIGKMPVVAFDFEPIDGVRQTAAHFHWGSRTFVNNGMTNGYYGGFDQLTVPTDGTYTGNTVWTTLTAPYIFSGSWDVAVPASEIFKANGYKWYLWPNSSITTYEAGNLCTTTKEEGGQVRFGEYSLELDYDYASYDGSTNANFYIRNCGDPYYIDGTPNEVGVWVYADKQAYGYWLYADIEVWNGSDYSTKNAKLIASTKRGTANANNMIDWEGWMYCYADISSLAQYYSEEHPLAVITGAGLIWLSYQPGGGTGGRYAGTLYFDNFRFVYGTDFDDLDNPEIDAISVNGTVLEEDAVPTIDTDTVEITAAFEDSSGQNVSGIDTTATTIKIDGEQIMSDGDETAATTRLSLANGLHSVQVTVYDKFGNFGTMTRYFNVQKGEETATAVLAGPEKVTMGSSYTLTLSAQGPVSEVSMDVIQINSDFGKPVVTFTDGWEGESVYTSTGFKKAKMNISAKWTGEGEAPETVATVAFDVPTDMDPEIDFFTYQVTKTECVLSDGTTVTAAQESQKLELGAYYTVTADVSVAGHDTVFKVVDSDEQPVSGVEVYLNNTLAGTTDENGTITSDIAKGLTGGTTYTVYAKNGSRISFTKTVTVMDSAGNTDGKPTGVSLTASSDGSSEQTVSWMSCIDSTEEKAVVEYVKAGDYNDGDCAYERVEGTSNIHAFATSKQAARINVVKLTALEPDTSYCYRVGDGTEANWSEVGTFKTAKDRGATSFFVIGDTQMSGNSESDVDEIAILQQIASGVADCDFGIQTGDYIDNGGNYVMWEEMQTVFGNSFSGLDIIHTFGNHEYFGDADGTAGAELFNLTDNEKYYYSVEYGDVYVAVINYDANLTEALEWLVEDANASTAVWKVLSIHQPAYYTNVNGGSDRFNKAVPAAAQKAGIDVVFSGHDHSYARTEPMTDGQVDEENGIVYFICGDMGEKSRNLNYAAVDNPEFHFAFVSQEYEALYLTVEADSEMMIITARDADGSILDSYTLDGPCVDGHTWVYERSGKTLTCKVCGETGLASDMLYSGWATDSATGGKMYFASGKYCTGIFRVSDVRYYGDANGLVSLYYPSSNSQVVAEDDASQIEPAAGTSAAGIIDGETVYTVNSMNKEIAVTTTTTRDADGNVTSVTRKTKIAAASKSASVVVNTTTDGSGKIQSATAAVTATVAEGNKVSITGSVVKQLIEAAGTDDVEVTVTVKDSDGKTKYKVKADADDLTAGKNLKVYQLNKKTGEKTMVNGKTYTVNKNGTVSLSMTKNKTYVLVTEKAAKTIDKAIKATVKSAKTSVSVKTGKSVTVKLSSKLNQANVKSVTYTSDKKSVATVNKKGKVTAKKAGTATIKMKVTLKNGTTKTVKTKVKVK